MVTALPQSALPQTATAQTATAREIELADELQRQFQFLMREAPVRFVATAVAYGMGMIFLPVPLILAAALLDLLGEIVTWQILRGDSLALARNPARRRVMLAAIILIETCFALPAALMWHIEDPYVKALAVGLMSGSMMHLATARSIHLPTGIAGWVTLAVAMAVSNGLYWLQRGDWASLAVTSLCEVVALGYFAAAMLSNNRLHRETAEGRRVALAADAAKGRFLAQMSHELRTPLNAILGLSHAELRRAADPIGRERLGAIVASAEGLGTLLDDILDLSAMETGRLPIRPTPAIPAEEICAAAALWRPGIEEAGLGFALTVDPALDRPAMLDCQRTRQCLSNLLSNALRHTVRGGISLTARHSESLRRGGRWLSVEVADTGPGIPDALRATLFAAPAAAGPAPPRPDGNGSGGHGIGLSIAYAMARQMGGDLTLQPADPDRPGARFTLLLPLPAAPAPVRAAPRAETPLRGRRVLVVDDIATNRMVAAACLTLLGARVDEAASGPATLDRLAQGGADAVLLDLNMPGMDGRATLAEIRRQPGPAARVPVVAMTADAMPGDRAACLAAGFDGYIAKPVTPDRLAETFAALDAAARPRHLTQDSPA
jgi:signal transduction histidine kinase/ActR/RegA family two-component response regulator